MTWVKLDDQFFARPRCRLAGRDGRELYLAGLCYCSMNLTDGVIVDAAIPLVAAQAEVEPSVADLLVSVGLWERSTDAFNVVDFLDYNPSREKVLAERSAARDRMARSRDVRANTGRSSPASSPSPSTSIKSSSSPTLVGPGPDDDLWKAVAQRQLGQQQVGSVRNQAGWLRTAASNARLELGERADQLRRDFDLSDGQLVDVLLSATSPQWLNTCRRPA